MGVIITLTLGDQHDSGGNLMHINYFEQHLTLTKYWMRVSCCLCWGAQPMAKPFSMVVQGATFCKNPDVC